MVKTWVYEIFFLIFNANAVMYLEFKYICGNCMTRIIQRMRMRKLKYTLQNFYTITEIEYYLKD